MIQGDGKRARRRSRKTKPKTRLDEVGRLWRHPIDGCCSKWIQMGGLSANSVGNEGTFISADQTSKRWQSRPCWLSAPTATSFCWRSLPKLAISWWRPAIKLPAIGHRKTHQKQVRSNAKCNSAPHPMFLDVGQRSFTSPLHLHAYAQNTTVEVLWVSPTGRRAPFSRSVLSPRSPW